MKTAIGIALGFALMPATLALIGGFAALSMWFDVRRVDTMIGAALGLATLVIGAGICVKTPLSGN